MLHYISGFGNLNMGNEMGNNNTSGLQEEIKTSVEAQEESVQETVNANDENGENHIVPAAEAKDYHEKETGLASADPRGAGDPHVENQTSDGKEQKETEVQLPIESPKVEVNSNDVGGEDSEIEPASLSETSKDGREQEETEAHAPTVSPKVEGESNEAGGEGSEVQPASSSKDFEDNEKLQEFNLLENLSGTSDHQLEKQASIKKVEDKVTINSTFDTTSTSQTPESQESVDSKSEQHESAKIHVGPSVQDGNGFPQESEEILGSSLTSICEENGHLLDTDTLGNLSGNVVLDTNSEVEKKRDNFSVNEIASTKEKLSREVEFGIRDGDEMRNDLSKITMITTDSRGGLGKKCNGELPTEMSLIRNDSPKLQAEAIPVVESQNSHLEVSESEDEGMVLTEETKLIGKKTENGDDKPDHQPTESFEESVKESKNDMANASQSISTMIRSDLENNENGGVVDSPCDSRINKDSQSEEAKVVEIGYSVDVQDNKQNEASEEHSMDSERETAVSPEPGMEPTELIVTNCQHEEAHEEHCKNSGETMVVPEPGMVPTELIVTNCKHEEAYEEHCKNSGETMVVPESGMGPTDLAVTDCKLKEEEPTEKKIVEDVEDKTEASFETVNNTERRETAMQCMSQPHLVEQVEVFPPESPVYLVQSQDHPVDTEMASKKFQSSNESITELKQEIFGEFFVTKASTFDSTNLIADTFVSVVELETDKPVQDHSQYSETAPMTVAETKTGPIQSSDQCAKVETSAFASNGNEAQEFVGRFSTESNPDNLNSHIQMRKSPSFGLDLRIEARVEESDQTPLLYQDKSTIESLSSQADVSLGNQVVHTKYGQAQLQYQSMPVEEKVITLERRDSEESRTPFLGFSKKDEEVHIMVTPQKQDSHAAAKKPTKDLWKSPTKEAASTAPKSKEKHRRRASLFGTCMCCATVIN